jgi:DNA mismatch repair protein MutS
VCDALRDATIAGAAPALLADHLRQWDDCEDIGADIRRTIVADAPIAVGDDPTIAPGVDPELDELRTLRDGGRDSIARIQADERERTRIK